MPSCNEIGPVVSEKKTFKVFLYRYIEKISPAPWRPGFLMNHDGLHNLDRGLHKKHFCNVKLKSVQWFLTRRSLKFSMQIYGENKPHPYQPCFLTNHDSLNNLGKGSPRKHICQVILKSIQWFLTRRFFQVFYIDIYRENKPRPYQPFFFDKS